MVAGTTSGIVLDKIWISATDNRTRKLPQNKFDHYAMNGVRIPKNEYFEVPTLGGSEKLEFAGDPKGSAGNVINCRCANTLVPRRDRNGRIVRVNNNNPIRGLNIRENNIRKYEQTSE
jgi:hypothetical protein